MIGSWSPQSLLRAQRYTSLIKGNGKTFSVKLCASTISKCKHWTTNELNSVSNKSSTSPSCLPGLGIDPLWSCPVLPQILDYPPLNRKGEKFFSLFSSDTPHLLCFRAVTTRCCSCPSGQHNRQWTCLVRHCTGAISLAQSTPLVSASAGSARVRIR